MTNSTQYDRLLQSTQQTDALVLTPNKRLAAHLQKIYADRQEAIVWRTPQILSLNAWLENCWQQLLKQGRTQRHTLLTSTQAKQLWQQIIQTDSADNLLNVTKTAAQAEQAWALLQQWQLAMDDPRLMTSTDHEVFLSWAQQYQALCLENHWLDTAQLFTFIQQALKQGILPLPEKVIFAGFLEFRPDISSLIETLKQQGCTIEFWQPYANDQQCYQTSFLDTSSELTAMCQWGKNKLNQAPTATIACVIPQLSQYRKQIENCFYETFDIDRQITSNLPFNISGGKPLLDTPVVHAAFLALQLKQQPLTLSLISRFLHSPFFLSNHNEQAVQALFAVELQQTQQATWFLNQLINRLIQYNPELALIDALTNLTNHEIPSKTTPSHWAQCFSELLSLSGWPGRRSLTSHEYQAVQRWLKLLDEFADLEIVQKELDYQTALALLTQLAQNTLFQPESQQAPIQVLGLLEAVGTPFDFIWVMGLDDTSWPTPPNPHPLIPYSLQRELAMPHCSAQRELEFCRAVTHQLQQATPCFIASYSRQQDEITRQASPLITNLSQRPSCDSHSPSSRGTESSPGTGLTAGSIDKNSGNQPHINRGLASPPRATASLSLESLFDDQAPPLQKNERAKGGTGIIKQQAACPFRAFAQYRLKADKIEQPEWGISAKVKGLLLHKALELLWSRLGSQQQLLHLSEQQRKQAVEHAIKQAFQTIRINVFNQALIALEKQRQQTLLLRWLDYEAQRQPFRVIATEQWQQIQVGKLRLRVQVDRIDEDPSTQHILIDYKTGNTNPNDWFGYRPNEPQLPLYTIAHQLPTTAMAFAQLKPSDMRFKGLNVSDEALLDCQPINKLKECDDEWSEQIKSWRKTLFLLANNFSEGEAEVDPKDPHRTCDYCHLHSLCRIRES